MPRLSTPLSSSGTDGGGRDSPIMMDGRVGDHDQGLDGSGGEENPSLASASDVANDENSGDDIDQVLDGLPKNSAVAPPPENQGVKRKRGRPTKAEAIAKKAQTASKDDGSSHRRSGRVTAQVKSETVNAAAAQPAKRGRPKKDAASKPSPATQQKGKKATGPGKVGRPAKQKEWDVESIVAVRTDAATNQEEYFVKWKGYPAKDNTWEPKENLDNCQGALENFEANKKAPKKRGRPSKKLKTKG